MKCSFPIVIATVAALATAGNGQTQAMVATHDSAPFEMSDSDKASVAIQFMNYLRYVAYEIDSYQNVFVIEDEYRNLSSDNLNLELIPDDDIKQAIIDHLNLLNDIRIDEKLRVRFEDGQRKAAQRHRQDMLVNFLKDATAASLDGGATIATIAGTVMTGSVNAGTAEAVKELARASADESFKLYDNYVEFQRRLEDSSEDFKIRFDDKRSERLHAENLKNFDFALTLLRKYGLKNEHRLAEQDAKALIECVKSSDKPGAFDRLKIMAKRQPSFTHFPMFWCQYAAFAVMSDHPEDALEACRHFEDVNRYSLFRSDKDRMAAQTAMAKIQALIDLDRIDRAVISDALDVITRYNNNSHDYDMAFFCASTYYSCLGDKTNAIETLNGLIGYQRQETGADLVKYRDLFREAKDDMPYEMPPMVTDLARCLALRETINGSKTADSFRSSLKSVFANTVLQGIERFFMLGDVRAMDLFKKAEKDFDGLRLEFQENLLKDDDFEISIPIAWFALGDFPVSIDLMCGTTRIERLEENFSARRISFNRPVSANAVVNIMVKCPARKLKGVDSLILNLPNKSWPVTIRYLPPAGVDISNAEFEKNETEYIPVSVNFIGKQFEIASLDKCGAVTLALMSGTNIMADTQSMLEECTRVSPNDIINRASLNNMISQLRNDKSLAPAIPFPKVPCPLNTNDLISVSADGRDLVVSWTNSTDITGTFEITAHILSEIGATIDILKTEVQISPSSSGTETLKWPVNLANAREPAVILLSTKKTKSLNQIGKEMVDVTVGGFKKRWGIFNRDKAPTETAKTTDE